MPKPFTGFVIDDQGAKTAKLTFYPMGPEPEVDPEKVAWDTEVAWAQKQIGPQRKRDADRKFMNAYLEIKRASVHLALEVCEYAGMPESEMGKLLEQEKINATLRRIPHLNALRARHPLPIEKTLKKLSKVDAVRFRKIMKESDELEAMQKKYAQGLKAPKASKATQMFFDSAVEVCTPPRVPRKRDTQESFLGPLVARTKQRVATIKEIKANPVPLGLEDKARKAAVARGDLNA